jgi:transposase
MTLMVRRREAPSRLLDGEAMTDVYREFGISRKAGYKIFDRYKEHSLKALSDRCRQPTRGNQEIRNQEA